MRTHSETYVTFVDLSAVDGCLLAEQVVGRAEKHPANPVLIPGDAEAWDSDRVSNWAASIAWDPIQRQFTAWYYGTDRGSTVSFGAKSHSAIGYAVSDDGVVWEKPRLGLYEHAGSKDNNICFRPPEADASHFCVLIDPDAPDDRRYQALTWMPVADAGADAGDDATANVFEGATSRMRYVAHYSGDGIQWQQWRSGVQWPDGDTGHLLIDPSAPAGSRVKAYGQHSVGEGPDIEHLVKQTQLPIDPQEGVEHEIHFVYVLPQAGRYVMLYDFNRYRPFHGHLGYTGQGSLNMTRQDRIKARVALRRGELPDEPVADAYGIYTGDIRLAVSGSALGPFERVQPRVPVVARGDRGEWDSGFLVLGGGSAIEHDDRIFLFYTGLNETSAATFTGPASGRVCTGLATLRKDGFASLRAADPIAPGEVTTQPIEVVDGGAVRLTVNLDHAIPWRDWIEVEVLDAGTLHPIPGYSAADARPLMADSIAAPVAWREHRTLAGVGAGPIRLRFHLYGRARLYSFTFTP